MAHIRMKSFSYGGGKKPIQVVFSSSQTYTIPSGYKSMDAFLVGGGGSGANRNAPNSRHVYSGAGGSGGYTKTQTLVSLTSKSLTITVGGANANSEVQYNASSKITANCGKTQTAVMVCNPVDGGSGSGRGGQYGVDSDGDSYGYPAYDGGTNGGNGGGSNPGKGQGTTTKAWGSASGTLYSGGGGGGMAYWGSSTVGQGGNGGGGNGASGSANGQNGTANTGGGGGGGSGGGRSAGTGGSGIVIIRLYPNNKRPAITWNSNNTINK